MSVLQSLSRNTETHEPASAVRTRLIDSAAAIETGRGDCNVVARLIVELAGQEWKSTGIATVAEGGVDIVRRRLRDIGTGGEPRSRRGASTGSVLASLATFEAESTGSRAEILGLDGIYRVGKQEQYEAGEEKEEHGVVGVGTRRTWLGSHCDARETRREEISEAPKEYFMASES